MSTGAIVAIVAVAAILAGMVAFFAQTRRKHPENSAGHQAVDPPLQPAPPPVGLQRDPGTDRPGDAGTEGMAAPEPGEVFPGPPPPHR